MNQVLLTTLEDVRVTSTAPYNKQRGELPRAVQIVVTYEEEVGARRIRQPGEAKVTRKCSGTVHMHLNNGMYEYRSVIGYNESKPILGDVIIRIDPSKLKL